MTNLIKIILMLSLTTLIIFIVSKHNIYHSSIIIVYSLFLLPYIAKLNGIYNFKKSLIAIGIIIIYMSLINLFSVYIATLHDNFTINNQFVSEVLVLDTIIFFIILILTLIALSYKNYNYTHYYFIILLLLEWVRTIGRGTEGNIFSFINWGVILYLFTIIYYSIYILNVKYFQVKNYISVYFGVSFGLLGLSLIIWDAKYNKFHFQLFEKYEIHENTLVLLLGFSLLLFFYGVYSLFLENRKGFIDE